MCKAYTLISILTWPTVIYGFEILRIVERVKNTSKVYRFVGLGQLHVVLVTRPQRRLLTKTTVS